MFGNFQGDVGVGVGGRLGYWVGMLRNIGVNGVLGRVGGCSIWFAGGAVVGRVDDWLNGWWSRYAREGVSGRLVLSGWADSEYLGWWWSRWADGGIGGRMVE